MMGWFVVTAALGGALRFIVDARLQPVGVHAFPRATFTVNIVGSLLIGLVSHAPEIVVTIIGVGFCGALTTFSGVALQLQKRFRARAGGLAIVYILALVLCCGLAIITGQWLSSLIWN